MTKARRDGLYLLIIGSTLSVLLGLALAVRSPASMADIKTVYVGARCLIHHQDPYQVPNYFRAYWEKGGPGDTSSTPMIDVRYLYLPSAFSLTVPFALLPWVVAQVVWLTILVGSVILASVLIWDIGAQYAPVLCAALICLVLGNSELLLVLGNAAGIAISLSVVATWCFIRRRFELAGVICLVFALILKPHDTGLVWLYFLLAGGTYRKRALQTLALTAVLCIPAIVWTTNVAPRWTQELGSNIAATSARGEINDPGPASRGAHDLGMMINLQEALSFFRDDPQFYNTATYLVCGALLLIWSIFTFRVRLAPGREWMGLAVIAALSLLPVYHRQYDAKLLLLIIPACIQLVAEGGVVSHIALLLSTAALLFTGELSWALYLEFLRKINLGLSGRWLEALQVLPIPLILLATAIFYLWAYIQRASLATPLQVDGESQQRSLQLDPAHS